MAPPLAARLRLLALCVAVLARAAALAAVTALGLTVLQNGTYAAYLPDTLAAWLALAAGPGLVVSLFVGPIAGSRWNRVILVGGTAVMVAVLAWAYADPGVPLLSVVGLLSLEAVVFGTAALAAVPALVREGRWMLPFVRNRRLGPIPAGVLVAPALAGGLWGFTHSSAADLPLALLAAVVALVAGVFVRVTFEDPVALQKGLARPVLAGIREMFGQRLAWSPLLGLWVWGFVALAVGVAVIRIESAAAAADGAAAYELLHNSTLGLGLAFLLGHLVSLLNRNAFRHGGFLVVGFTLLAGACVWYRFGGSWEPIGFGLGLTISPLLHMTLTWTSPRHHGVAAALVFGSWCAAAVVFAGVLVALGPDPLAARLPLATLLLVVTTLAAVAAWLTLFRPLLELVLEVLVSPVYRITTAGPGVEHLPARGPCLVIANHAAWFDPLFLAKALQAPTVPMMTSKFYDLPVIAWLMRNVIGTIRVPDSAYRREAPELKEAVAALNRGANVILFPEGFLRRKAEVPLRRFGRGVWQILHDRPDTPVFACWIEGSWESYTSFKGGPPTKNKRWDFWRPIRIGIRGPFRLDAETLADHMTTRRALMQEVNRAREPLGLDPLKLPAAAAEGDEA